MVRLSFDNIHKRFPGKHGDHPVLKGFSWSAQSGEIVGLVGPNGAGKTTSLHLLMGFLSPDAGDVLISTPPAHALSPSKPKNQDQQNQDQKESNQKQISSDPLSSDFSLIKEEAEDEKSWSEDENPLSKAPVLSLVQSPPFAFQSWCSLLPEHPMLKKSQSGKDALVEYALLDGLSKEEAHRKIEEVKKWLPVDLFWDKPSLHYSRGQAALISLGRVMMIDRPIVLLDEPTVGLDFEATKKVHAWMRHQASEGKIVILSTHLLNDLNQLTTNIVGLQDGQRVPDDLLDQWMNNWQ